MKLWNTLLLLVDRNGYGMKSEFVVQERTEKTWVGEILSLQKSHVVCVCIISMILTSAIAKRSIALDFPVPQILASPPSVQVNVDSQFSIDFEVSNLGDPSSTDSYLSISISHGLEILSWSSTPSLPDLSFYKYGIGDLIWNNQFEQIPAEYVLLDVTGHPFDAGESVIVTVVFRSQSYQSLEEWIEFRISMLPEGVNYPTHVPEARDPTSADVVDQQGYPVYMIDIHVWVPWDDWDGDSIENFLDIESNMQSLIDYGMPEDRIYAETVEYLDWWKFELSGTLYLIAPESESEVEILSNWVKAHASTADYDFVTSELLDNYIPFLMIYETDKDVLTMLPFGSLFFHLLPADSTYNWIRWAVPMAFPDPLTILQVVSDDKNLPQILYAFPCITDGDGYSSHLTERELLFRFTRPLELTVENAVNFGFDAVLTFSIAPKIGAFLKGLLPLSDLAGLIVREMISFFLKLAWESVKAIEEAVCEGVPDFLAALLEDPQGDVDMALFVDDNFVLGTFENVTIVTSEYGEYLGDYPSELMLVYTTQIATHSTKVVLTAPEVVGVENISLSWMSFNETYLVTHETFNETIAKADEKEYEIMFAEEIPRVIPEFPSFLILPLLLISTFVAVTIYRRKYAKEKRSRETQPGGTSTPKGSSPTKHQLHEHMSLSVPANSSCLRMHARA